MEKLTTLATSFVAGKAMKNLNLGRIVQVLMGNIPSTHKEAATASLFLDLSADASVAESILEVGFDALRGRGIDEGELFRLLGGISPMVGVDAPKTRAQLVATLRVIANRVVDKQVEETIPHNATVVCPKCKYVHAV